MVWLRLSCAVNRFAAQAATPSEPLPSGSDWEFTVFGRPSTMSERETTPLVFTEKAPLRQAVVTAAADALWVLPRVAATSAVATASRQAEATVRKRRSVYRAGMSPSQGVGPYYVRNRRGDHPSGLAPHTLTVASPATSHPADHPPLAPVQRD